jgi:hypothetical protein
MHTLYTSLQHTLSLLSLLCLHQSLSGNGFQSRRFLSYRVPVLWSSLAGACLTTLEGVAWLHSSNNGYPSRPYGSNTALPNHRLKIALLCPWPSFQGPGPPLSYWLQLSFVIVSGRTAQKTQLPTPRGNEYQESSWVRADNITAICEPIV